MPARRTHRGGLRLIAAACMALTIWSMLPGSAFAPETPLEGSLPVTHAHPPQVETHFWDLLATGRL